MKDHRRFVLGVAGHLVAVAAAVVGIGALSAGPASADEGNLSFVECLEDTGSAAACRDAVGNDGLSGTAGVIVSPDGEHTYVASGIDNTVSVFARNINTGKLDFIEVHKDGVAGVNGLAGARDIDMSPDGRSVYVTGQVDSAVVAFSRNPRTGKLTFIEFEKNGVGGVDGIDSANGVTVSPDGKQVYVTGFGDDAIATFSRNSTTGELTFVSCLADTVAGTPLSTCPSTGGIDGIRSAWDTTISPDGKFLYASGPGDDAVAIFSRNLSTGALTFSSCIEDTGGASPTCASPGGMDGLDNAVFSALSPDGRHLYVAAELERATPAGSSQGAITVLSRNANTGSLSFVQTLKEGLDGVTSLQFAIDVAVSADGKHVYVTASSDDAVTTFTRNGSTGALTLLEAKSDGIAGVEGMNGAFGVALSPDDRHVYVAGRFDNAVALFSRENDETAPETASLVGPGAVTEDSTPTFTFSTNDRVFSTFECKVDAGPFEPCASPFTTFALADGPHRFQVRARDTAGNVDPTPAVANFTVQLPVPTGPAGPPGETGPAGADGQNGSAGPAGANGKDGANGRDGANGKDGATGPPGRDAQVTCTVKKKTAKKVKVRCQVALQSAGLSRVQWALRTDGQTVDRGTARVARGKVRLSASRFDRHGPGRYALFIKGHGRALTFVVR